MSPEDIRAEADDAARAFAKLVGQDSGTTGIPKPVEIVVTQTETDVEKFGLQLNPKSTSAAPPAQGQPGPPPPPPELTCAPPEVASISVAFSGIVACSCLGSGTESFLGANLGMNASFVLPRISSTSFQLSAGAIMRVTKWSPSSGCSGTIEFVHDNNCLVFASCNASTGLWTVAIQQQGDFFYGFFGRGTSNPIAAEGVCDFPTSPDLFHQGTATITI